MRTVSSQLAAFQSSMEKDSAAQSAEVGALLRSAADRGKGFVDATLQLSNVQALSTYLLGSTKDAQNMTIAKGNPPPLGPINFSCNTTS